MAKRILKRTSTPDILGTLRQYLLNRSMRERSDFIEGTHKAELMAVLETHGREVEGGHREISVEPQPFTAFKGGQPVTRNVVGIQRQQRAGSMRLDPDRALAYVTGVTDPKLKEALANTVVWTATVDEDALLALNFEGVIPDEVLKGLYEEGKPTFAFILKYDDE